MSYEEELTRHGNHSFKSGVKPIVRKGIKPTQRIYVNSSHIDGIQSIVISGIINMLFGHRNQ